MAALELCQLCGWAVWLGSVSKPGSPLVLLSATPLNSGWAVWLGSAARALGHTLQKGALRARSKEKERERCEIQHDTVPNIEGDKIPQHCGSTLGPLSISANSSTILQTLHGRGADLETIRAAQLINRSVTTTKHSINSHCRRGLIYWSATGQ